MALPFWLKLDSLLEKLVEMLHEMHVAPRNQNSSKYKQQHPAVPTSLVRSNDYILYIYTTTTASISTKCSLNGYAQIVKKFHKRLNIAMESPWKIQTTWKYVLCRCIFSTFFLGEWLKKDLYCHVGYSNWMVFPIFNNFIKKKIGSTNFCKIHDRIVCSHCCWGQQFCKNLQFSNNFMQYPFCKHHVFPNHFVVVFTQYPFCKVLQFSNHFVGAISLQNGLSKPPTKNSEGDEF